MLCCSNMSPEFGTCPHRFPESKFCLVPLSCLGDLPTCLWLGLPPAPCGPASQTSRSLSRRFRTSKVYLCAFGVSSQQLTSCQTPIILATGLDQNPSSVTMLSRFCAASWPGHLPLCVLVRHWNGHLVIVVVISHFFFPSISIPRFRGWGLLLETAKFPASYMKRWWSACNINSLSKCWEALCKFYLYVF